MTFTPRSTMSRRHALLALSGSALSGSLLLAGCGGGSSDSGGGALSIRAINLTSDLPSVDLYAGDTQQFSALTTDVLTPTQSMTAADYTLAVRRAGDGTTLLSGSYSLAKDKHYTAVVWGRETALHLSTLPEDETDSDIGSGNTRLRVFNATTDSGSLDVYFTSASADINETTATLTAIGATSLSGYREFSRGSYRLRVTGAGDPNDVRLDIADVTLAEKQHASLVLTAGASGVLVNGWLIVQQGAGTSMKNTKARVRVVAGADSSGNVAVTFGSRTLAGGLRSPSVGPYQLVDAGAAAAEVRINGSIVSSGSQTLAAGTDYSLLTFGSVDNGQVRWLVDDNRLPVLATRSKLRLVHGAAGTDPLTLSVDYLALATETPVGTASAYATTLSSASARVDVTAASALAAVYSATEVNLQAQSVYTVFVLGGNSTATGVIRKER